MTMGYVASRHRRPPALFLGIMLGLLACSLARADQADDARTKAKACSQTVISREVLKAEERSAALAGRAYDSCIDAWGEAAHLLSDRMAVDPATQALRRHETTFNGSTPVGAYLGLRSASLKLRTDFIRAATSEIRAMRTEATAGDAANR